MLPTGSTFRATATTPVSALAASVHWIACLRQCGQSSSPPVRSIAPAGKAATASRPARHRKKRPAPGRGQSRLCCRSPHAGSGMPESHILPPSGCQRAPDSRRRHHRSRRRQPPAARHRAHARIQISFMQPGAMEACHGLAAGAAKCGLGCAGMAEGQEFRQWTADPGSVEEQHCHHTGSVIAKSRRSLARRSMAVSRDVRPSRTPRHDGPVSGSPRGACRPAAYNVDKQQSMPHGVSGRQRRPGWPIPQTCLS